MAILSRVAENLFWIGRYVERAKSVARLINVTTHLELDAGGPEEWDVDFWTPLLGPTGHHARIPGGRRRERSAAIRRYLAFDHENPNLAHSGSLGGAVRSVNEGDPSAAEESRRGSGNGGGGYTRQGGR